MKKHLILIFSLLGFLQISAQTNRTATYKECIDFYQSLTRKYKFCELKEIGPTDGAYPLQVFFIHNANKKFNPFRFLINNGIHPGEPEGIDASMNIAAEICGRIASGSLKDNFELAIIPLYNIEGSLNRGCCSRVNQNGPIEYGFRGNGQNLDLNRDFVKMDARNTRSLVGFIHTFKPDFFLDTHTSDGADYQYNMTLIPGQPDKMNALMGSFMRKELLPDLYQMMASRGEEISPYVDPIKEIPDSGIAGFLETPRFSSGFTNLFNIFSFVSETHMWKPFELRKRATEMLIRTLLEYGINHAPQIHYLRNKADEDYKMLHTFPVAWKLDTTRFDSIIFRGYTATYVNSSVTGLKRLKYHRDQPYTKRIRYYQYYKKDTVCIKPQYFVVPQAWNRLIENLKINKIELKPLKNDTLIDAKVFYIDNYKTVKNPYEGHYLHTQVNATEKKEKITVRKGDFLIRTGSEKDRFLMEVLCPYAPDSYLAWNFFDAVLQQKEGFSDYIFEDIADSIIHSDSKLMESFTKMRKENKDFAESPYLQLKYIYQHSKFFESVYMRYPVFWID